MQLMISEMGTETLTGLGLDQTTAMWSAADPRTSLNQTSIPANCSLHQHPRDMLFVVTYSLIFSIGVPASLAALYSICHLIKSSPIQFIFLLNLTAADLLYLLVLPLWIMYFMQDQSWTLGPTACKAVGTMYFINMYASIYFLCCIAVDRFLGIMFPFRFRDLRTLKSYAAVSLAGWLFVILCHVPVILWLELSDSHFCYQGYAETTFHAVIIFISSSLGFLGPFCILLFSYQAAIRRLGRGTLRPGSAVWIKSLLLVCLLTFVSCFGPYHCMLLVHAVHFFIYGPDCEFLQVTHTYYKVSVVVTTLNTLLDPILYIFISKDVRTRLKRVGGPAGCVSTSALCVKCADQ